MMIDNKDLCYWVFDYRFIGVIFFMLINLKGLFGSKICFKIEILYLLLLFKIF